VNYLLSLYNFFHDNNHQILVNSLPTIWMSLDVLVPLGVWVCVFPVKIT